MHNARVAAFGCVCRYVASCVRRDADLSFPWRSAAAASTRIGRRYILKTPYIRGKASITALAFTSMFFLGLGVTLIGATAHTVGITAEQVGILMTVKQLGFLSSIAVAGTLGDRRSKTRILAIGAVILAAGFYFFFRSEIFALNMLIIYMIGVGTGCFEGVTDALLVDTHGRRAHVYVSLNHFLVVLGMFLITLYMFYLGLQWRSALIQSGAVLLVLAVAAFITRDSSKRGSGRFDWAAILRLLGDKTMINLFIATMCAIGLEAGVIGITTSYLVELRGADSATASIGLLIFLAAHGTGRALIGPYITKSSLFRRLVLLFGASALTTFGAFILHPLWIIYVVLAFTGFAIANLLGILITATGRAFEETPATALGLIKLGIPLGGMVVSASLSGITSIASFQLGLMVFPVAAIVGVGVSLRLL